MTLTIQDLGALGELLGSIAVLATLVYLALQTRQNTLAIAAQLEAASLATNQSWSLSVATSNELEEAMAEDWTIEVPTNERRRGLLFGSLLASMQWHIRQSRRGLLSTVSQAQPESLVRGLFAGSRSFAGFWDVAKSNYLPEFVEWVEEQRSKAA